MKTRLGTLAIAGLLVLAACNGDDNPSDYQLGTGGDAPVGGDSNTMGGDIDAAGCACDTTSACDGWCYCDLDCADPCGCDESWACEPTCGCDVGCGSASVDLYPYNLCHNNSDCDGGFCLKGSCVSFCDPTLGCGYGFSCVEDVCLFDCTTSADCEMGSSTNCCVAGSCIPSALCGDDAGPAWQCPAGAYGGVDGCDCGCGLEDPDCDGSGCDWCNDTGALLPLCTP